MSASYVPTASRSVFSVRCPVHMLYVVVPVDVVEPVDAQLVAPCRDLAQELRVSFGDLGAGQEESPHEGLDAVCLQDPDPAAPSRESRAG